MTTRKYTSRSQQATLTSAVTSGGTLINVGTGISNLLGGLTIAAGETFTIVIDPDTALEEVVDVYSASGNPVSGSNLTITRAIDGSSAQDHSAGAVVRHMIIGRDLRESNTHIEASSSVHGLTSTSGVVVGTLAIQTLTNKTLVAPILTATVENDAGISFQGATVDAYSTTLTVVDPTANRTITLPNTSGTVGIIDAVQTLTNKTLTSPTINGSPVITGLSSAGMSASSAAPKDYVDAILGSAVAASTSAASAAVSATSSATSASSSLTSANSSAASATVSAASAATATTQATAATTSATSAAASATAAATSASSAATSATSAAASVSSIAGYATTASNSASAAATSATSAAASATAAATSASSAVTSATSAATSASSSLTTYNTYKTYYLGSFASAPTLDNQGNALITGATYFNSGSSVMYAWSGSAWSAISTASGAVTTGTLAQFAATTSSQLAGVISDETGSGALVFATSPTLVTPVLGVATATSINGTTIPSTKTLVVTTDKLSVHAATTSAELAGVISDETGTGALVFATSPTLVTPVLGTPTSVTLTNATGLPVSGITASTATALGVGSVELGHATDTTIARVSAGVASIEGVNIVTTSSTDTLTNKTLTAPIINTGYSAKTASYTTVLGDNGYLLSMNNASATTFSIPTNASVAYAVGAQISFAWITGAGQPTIQAVTSGTTTILSTGATSTAPKLRVVNSVATAVKIATDIWLVTGDLA
jgi:hypothetical protein